jgi:hypothetical protein
MQVEKIFIGLAAGVTYALSSFAKTKGEKFDWEKFSITLLVGAGAGLISGLLDLPIENSYEYLLQIGVITVFENLFKAAKRKLM